ncbi:MAG: UDP-N-acetylglucosamine 1-carboxyvinyltransferase [Planctomycetes bacterium]|nr:UDP-N-acetylglucosamine 1-carboxyvinyltransferase [Planctomycetota bacterium]
MDKFIIHGGHRLRGSIRVNGSKNAALPMMAAALLLERDEVLVLRNVPDLGDVRTMGTLLERLGVRVERERATLKLAVADDTPVQAPYEIVKTMRAGICTLGPLVGRRGEAHVSHPGGCAIGVRPVDLHVRGIAMLGARVKTDHGYIVATAKRLRGGTVYLGGAFGSTVTGTANVLMAAVLARGTTVIEYAAQEPEVQELANLLNAMGARIEGIGSYRLVVHGVERLRGTRWTVIPDRIEAGTFMACAAVTAGDLLVENVRAEHMTAVLETLREMGCGLEVGSFSVRVRGPRRLRPVDLNTLPFPGFPTDLQSQFMACCCLADGISVVTEKIYPERFSHLPEFCRMGARGRKYESAAIISGVRELHGAPVMASDLRAGAGLVVAGLAARGYTEVQRIYHLDRGYDHVERRLNAVGAKIRRVAEKAKEAPVRETGTG